MFCIVKYIMHKFKCYSGVYYLWQYRELKKESGQKSARGMTMENGEKRGVMLERRRVNSFDF